jgi:hypothetical protein
MGAYKGPITGHLQYVERPPLAESLSMVEYGCPAINLKSPSPTDGKVATCNRTEFGKSTG